jgi:hypothetical protein
MPDGKQPFGIGADPPNHLAGPVAVLDDPTERLLTVLKHSWLNAHPAWSGMGTRNGAAIG